ncbi:hypothetical protein ACFV4N_21750 [Actinosynnema sp. NPDC059797]
MNETQDHLGGATGEQAAVALRTLLELPGPFVVLGTMWPRHWTSLVKNPRAGALLEHRVERIRVADRLDAAELAEVPADPRLLRALTTAHDGRVIQVVAGGPALVERHEHPDTPEDRFRLTLNAYHRLRYRHADPLYREAAATASPYWSEDLVTALVAHGRIGEVAELVR